MSEEAKAENTVNEPLPSDIRDEARETVVDVEFEPLFEKEAVTEEELMGEEIATDDKETAPSEPEGEKKEEPAEPPKEELKEEVKEEAKEEPKEEAPKDDKPDYSKPPPKGYVPIPALHEERKKNQSLQSEIAKLQGEIEAAKSSVALKSEFSDFKELSDKEFQELLEEDPVEAIKYDRKLRKFEEHRAAEKRAEGMRQRIEEEHKQITAAVFDEMVREVPGLRYKENRNEAEALIDFAVESGMDEAVLAVLTNPGTKIIPPGESAPLLLANGALGLLRLIKNAHGRANNKPDETKIRERIEKEVTDKLMGKLKQTETDSYRSLDSAPGASDTPKKTGKILSESELKRLNPEEYERYLMGEL